MTVDFRAARLEGLLACPDCRTDLPGQPTACPTCGRRFTVEAGIPVMHPKGSASADSGRQFFVDDPGRMDQLRRKAPWLARMLELPDFTSPSGALPKCREWHRAHVIDGMPGQRVLNLGSGVHKQYLNPGLINFDIAAHDNVDVVGDGEHLPFRDGVFDGVVLDAVIEHLARPARVVAEVKRVLKPGGTVLAQVPFLYPFHAAPHDYQRYTPAGLGMLFEEFDVLETGTDRRPGRAVLEVVSAWAAGFSDNRTVSYALRWLTAWVWLPIKWLDPWLGKKSRGEYVAASGSVLARKRAG
ncbi:MAG TPA: methyltransferase domain-containing protein [Candidatus Eisenbacteria bacterium]